MNKRIIIEFEKKVLFSETALSQTISGFIADFLSKKNRFDSTDYELYSLLHGHIPNEKTFAEIFTTDNEKFFLQKKSKLEPEFKTQSTEILPEIEFHISEIVSKGRVNSTEQIDIELFNKFQISSVFKDTSVENCYIKTDILNNLKHFCRKSISSGEKIEYGGFLLGKILEKPENQFDIFIKQFIEPSCYDYHDEYRIEFGHTAMIELDAALQKHSDCILVGWFHTHPGHTAFLSSFDLNIHNGSFTEPYQVAIVTDTFTPDFETGIFSRKKNKTLNNQHDLQTFFKWNP